MKFNSNRLIWLAFILLLMLIFPIVMLSFYQLNQFTDRLESFVKNVNVKTTITADMFSAARERSISLLRIANLNDIFDIDDERMHMTMQSSQFLTAYNQLLKMKHSKQEQESLDKLDGLIKIGANYQFQVNELLLSHDKKRADKILFSHAIPHQGKALEQIKKLHEVQQITANKQLLIVQQTRDLTVMQILILSCIAFTIGILIFYYISFKINDFELKLKDAYKETLEAWNVAEIANKTKTKFLENISHEMRTPMHAILNFSSMGSKKSHYLLPEKHLKYYTNIKTSAERLMVLINNLFDLTQLESGKTRMNFEKHSLLKVLNSCLIKQKLRLNELDMEVIIHPECVTKNSQFDSECITQVINNFLLNAIKHSSSGQTIDILITNTELDNEHGKKIPAISFSMQNYGKSIPEGECEMIFNKFVQSSDKVPGTTGGTGLGLPICKEIIKSHSGRIWANNSPSGGTVFTFVIPIE